jgi:hypothetical protein
MINLTTSSSNHQLFASRQGLGEGGIIPELANECESSFKTDNTSKDIAYQYVDFI